MLLGAFLTVRNAVFVENDYSIIGVKSNADNSEAGTQVPKITRGKGTSTRRKSVELKRVVMDGAEDSEFDESRISSSTRGSSLDVTACIAKLSIGSANWSYRDVSKTLQNIQCEVLGTEKYETMHNICFYATAHLPL